MKNGLMIVCDGGNGAGKSTLLTKIEKYIKEVKKRDVILTREPGGTIIGEKIRNIILDPATPEMSDITELMLFTAARAQHIREKIIPAIKNGTIVLCDRFDSATISFQHYGRGLSLDIIKKANNIALNGFKPDLSIILDIDPEIGLERVKKRGSKIDRLEKQKLSFLNRARLGYFKQQEQDPDNFFIIDASINQELVIKQALDIIDKYIN